MPLVVEGHGDTIAVVLLNTLRQAASKSGVCMPKSQEAPREPVS